MKLTPLFIAISFGMVTASCGNSHANKETSATRDTANQRSGAAVETVELPPPFATKSVNDFCTVVGWPAGKTPVVPQGFNISKFADSLLNPRWIYIGPNGDIFVCESNGNNTNIQKLKGIVSGKKKSSNIDDDASANRITLFRDANGDGIPETRTVFLTGLHNPLGMLILNNTFYVANTDAVMAYPYQSGQTSITAPGHKITDIVYGPGHWTRNIIASRDGKKIYLAVGSGSNAAENGIEKEEGRAMIWEMNPDGSGKRPYATGIRNPCGMAWAPGTNTLWTSVNERDGLGDDLVPDYLTSVKDGGFYGWPYCYWGQHEDPRLKDKQRPDMVKKAIVPDISMGSHTASLGLAFDERNQMPDKYRGGAFVGQHGSWNRSVLTGYAVVFVPFANGKPKGKMEPFVTGFIADSSKRQVYGRPVGVAFTKNGDLLLADDVSNIVWSVSKTK